MELLLNLIWIALAAGAFVAFLRARRGSSAGISFGRSLLALACICLLLFPIISASDDLHPTQALLEDAMKRVQRATPVPAPALHAAAPLATLLLWLWAIQTLTLWQRRTPPAVRVCQLDGWRFARDGRAPPSQLG